MKNIERRGWLLNRKIARASYNHFFYHYCFEPLVSEDNYPQFFFMLHIRRTDVCLHALKDDEDKLLAMKEKLTKLNGVLKEYLSLVDFKEDRLKEIIEENKGNKTKKVVFLNTDEHPSMGEVSYYIDYDKLLQEKSSFIVIKDCDRSIRLWLDKDDIKVLKGVIQSIDKALKDLTSIMK